MTQTLAPDQIAAMIGLPVDQVLYALNLRMPTKAVTPLARGSELTMALADPDPWRIYLLYDDKTLEVLDIIEG